MATENLELNYLTINQAQKEEVFNDNMNILDQEFNDLESRVTSLEEGGTGGTSYDDTELRNRITQNESDIEALEQTDISMTSDIESLQTLTSEHSSQISSLQTNNTNILNRLEDVEDNDVIQDSEINELEDRVVVLENAGGSGYNDTELRDRISVNEDDIVSLNNLYSNLNDRVDAIESVNSTQNSTLDNYNIRITDLEEASQFDPTNIENRLTDIEQDLSIVKTNQTNIQNDFQDLEDNVNTFDTRINDNDNEISDINTRLNTNESDIELLQTSQSNQDTEISDLDNRVTDLESSGGSSYDDTELRNRVTQNESDIETLQTNDTTQDQDIDALEVTLQNHESRITSLEEGGGTGGGEMPQTGEVRKFLESNIPKYWYKISEYPFPNDNNVEWLVANTKVNNGSVFGQDELKTTSSFNTFSMLNDEFYIFNKNTKDFDLINNDIGFSGDQNNSVFQKDGSNTVYIYNINSNGSITLLTYNLNDNTFTSFTSNVQSSSTNIDNENSTSLIDKNHNYIYTICENSDSNDSVTIFKTDVVNKVFEDHIIYTNDVLSVNLDSNDIMMIYFNQSGNIVLQYKSRSIEIDKDDITIATDYTNNQNSIYSIIDLNDIASFVNLSDHVWSGDNQFILARSHDEIVMIDNYSEIIYKDLFNIDLNNFNSISAISTIFFDIDSNLYCRSTSNIGNEHPLLVAKNRLFNTSNVTSNNFVDCVYNVPQ